MRKIFFHRGQSLTDLAVVIGLVGLAFIALGSYVRKGVQGKAKDFTDYILSDKQSEGDELKQSTELTSNSAMVSTGFEGGGSSLTGTEDSISTYKTLAP